MARVASSKISSPEASPSPLPAQEDPSSLLPLTPGGPALAPGRPRRKKRYTDPELQKRLEAMTAALHRAADGADPNLVYPEPVQAAFDASKEFRQYLNALVDQEIEEKDQ